VIKGKRWVSVLVVLEVVKPVRIIERIKGIDVGSGLIKTVK
jgi:hypothetical protein